MSNLSGKFLAKAISYNFGMSPAKGTPGCAVMFEVTKGEHAGATVSWAGWFTDKTAERAIESLEHMGWRGDDPQTATVEDLPNEVEIVVEVETWTNDEGRAIETSKVQWVNKVGAGVKLAAMGAGDSAAFASKMKGLVLGMRSKKPSDKATDFPHGANQQPLASTGTGKRAF